MLIYFSVADGLIANWGSFSKSSVDLFFRPQGPAPAATWNCGTHFTTDVRDKVAVVVITAVLVLVVDVVDVLMTVLVDKVTTVLVLVVVVV